MQSIKKVSCFGAGYVGGPTMAIFASKHPEIEFIVYDKDTRQIEKWNGKTKDLPVKESGLEELISQNRGKNLHFTTSIERCLQDTDIILLAVNTPVIKSDAGQYTFDIQRVEDCSRTLSLYFNQFQLEKDVIIVEKSTVPVGTSEIISEIIKSNQKRFPDNRDRFVVLSNPEFMAEGSAIRDLLSPERIIIGGGDSPREQSCLMTFKKLYDQWIPNHKIILTDIASSELSKLASNSFLAQRVSSINSLTSLCEIVGANIDQVRKCIGADSRIGSNFLQCSVGFGGSCFTKDVLGLASLCQAKGLPEVADYWRQVVNLNQFQKHRFSSMIVEKLYNNLCDKAITVLGLTFKKDTNDIRDSPAVTICYHLLSEGAQLQIYDPSKIQIEQLKLEMELQGIWNPDFEERINFTADGLSSAKNSHAIALLTEWDEFKSLDYEKMFKTMKRPSYFFDGRNLLQKGDLETIGYAYFCLGQK